MRDKLVELLTTTLTNGNDKVVILRKAAEDITEYLIANGVTIPVRCKDCKWRKTKGCPYMNFNAAARDDFDFCSDGERETDEALQQLP